MVVMDELRGTDLERHFRISRFLLLALEGRGVIRPVRNSVGWRRYSQADAAAIARYLEEQHGRGEGT